MNKIIIISEVLPVGQIPCILCILSHLIHIVQQPPMRHYYEPYFSYKETADHWVEMICLRSRARKWKTRIIWVYAILKCMFFYFCGVFFPINKHLFINIHLNIVILKIIKWVQIFDELIHAPFLKSIVDL